MTQTFIHLSASDDWEPFYAKFEHLDIYYSKEYAQLFAREEKGAAEAVYYEQGDTRIFYPYIKRNIDWTDVLYFDIVTPYGYGGPYLEGEPARIVDFYQVFRELCEQNRIITETVRLHPLLRNAEWLRLVMDVESVRKTTAVDLTKDYVQIRNGYTTNNMRNIKKAKQFGMELVEGRDEEHLHQFIDLYYETMDRNQAMDLYYFDKEYFAGQMKSTPLSESHLLLVSHQGEWIAGVLLLIGKKYAHYHLGASRTRALELRPNNLLFDFMIRYAKDKGAEWLHLGGGYQENDGLMKFKSSFSNGRFLEYCIGKKVYDPKIYAELTEMAEQRTLLNANFFPTYRAMAAENRHLGRIVKR